MTGIAITAGTNSFVTEAEAVTYSGLMLNVTAWVSPLTENQKKAKDLNTDKINSNFSFQHLKYDPDQALEWPRYVPQYSTSLEGSPYIINGVAYISTTPIDIKKATVYEAVALLADTDSIHAKNQAMGIKSLSLQGDSVTYTGSNTKGLLSKDAYNLVRKWTGAPKVV